MSSDTLEGTLGSLQDGELVHVAEVFAATARTGLSQAVDVALLHTATAARAEVDARFEKLLAVDGDEQQTAESPAACAARSMLTATALVEAVLRNDEPTIDALMPTDAAARGFALSLAHVAAVTLIELQHAEPPQHGQCGEHMTPRAILNSLRQAAISDLGDPDGTSVIGHAAEPANEG